MKTIFKVIISRRLFNTVLFLSSFIIFSSAASATSVNYTLDNVILNNNKQMTGSFKWTYQEGAFENGSGLFTDLYIPGYGSDINGLTINFNIPDSIEFSLTANIHNGGVNVTLFLANALTPDQGAILDLTRSSYEIEGVSKDVGFVSGGITPNLVPLPAAFWLFVSGLGFFGFFSGRKQY